MSVFPDDKRSRLDQDNPAWSDDVIVLIAAYDALLVERDALQSHLEEGMRMMLALQAERDQAAPVLAAAEEWAGVAAKLAVTDERALALLQSVEHWRAAREG